MDGLKLVSMVRNDPAHRSIPIIIITTEGAEEDRKRGMALGANAYIPKPIQTADLLGVVNGILGNK
jgi:two-component system, chemotaxis family, chemotaxis protein CheY